MTDGRSEASEDEPQGLGGDARGRDLLEDAPSGDEAPAERRDAPAPAGPWAHAQPLLEFTRGLEWMWRPVRESRGTTSYRIVLAGGLITLAFVVMAAFAPWLAPYDPLVPTGEAFEPPSWEHPFGTNKLGYDVLSNAIWGSRIALEVVLLATAFAMAIAIPLGLISGYVGGAWDRGLVMITDSIYAFPGLLLAIVIQALFGLGVINVAIAISVVYIPQYFRVIRNHVASVKEEAFVEAARAMGAPPRTVVGKYVFFNVVQSVPVIFTLNAADAILTLAALGFLGYGLVPPTPEWGYNLQKALSDVTLHPVIWWTNFWPGIFIVLLVLGITLLGEGLNDVINPLLREKNR